MILKIYFCTIIFNLFPKVIEKSIYLIKLKKEGYYFDKNNYSEFSEIITSLFIALVPIINIINGFGTINKIINNKKFYAEYKLLLLKNKEIFLEKELSLEEEMAKTFDTIRDYLELNEGEKNIKFDKIKKIASLLEYLSKNGYDFSEDIDYMSLDEKLQYFTELKAKIEEEKKKKNNSKSFDEMSNEEKISYIRRKKEDLERNDSELSLKKDKKDKGV